MHTSFPVRRVAWRKGYTCEVAVVSNADFGGGLTMDMPHTGISTAGQSISGLGRASISSSPRMGFLSIDASEGINFKDDGAMSMTRTDGNDPIEIWDVRRGYIAKWVVSGSAVEGGVTGMFIFHIETLCNKFILFIDVEFGDSHALWAQHTSGTFSQLDLRHCVRPLDMVTRTAVTWDVAGSLVFVADHPKLWEVPYDDMCVSIGVTFSKSLIEKNAQKSGCEDIYLGASEVNEDIGRSAL